MKIVALHTDFRIYWPARLKSLSDFLISQGNSLEVIEIAGEGSPYAFAGRKKTNDLKWHILRPNDKPEDLSGKEVKQELFNLLDSINPDVIFAGAIAFPSGALAVQWCKKNNKGVIIFDDAKIEAVKRNGLINFIKQSVYNGVDAMLYPAKEQWSETGHFWGFEDERMFDAVDVVDNDFWSSEKSENPYGFEYMMAVGRQIPKKNYLTIVKAYHKYAETVGRNNAYKFILIGDGPEHKTIMDYIKKNALNDLVVCHEFMNQQDLRRCYTHANLLCSNSNSSETWGLVINEAMCCGCAIIASKECGATDVLVHESDNGYKTLCNDIDGLADAFIKYHNLTKQEKSKMAEASRQIISQWGLERFSYGVYNAAKYVINNKRRPNILSRIIINKWNGRYNPV